MIKRTNAYEMRDESADLASAPRGSEGLLFTLTHLDVEVLYCDVFTSYV